MEILRFSNHFSQINEQGNKSCSHSHRSSAQLSLLYLIPSGQVWSGQQLEDFKLEPHEDYLFNDRLSRTHLGLSCIP